MVKKIKKKKIIFFLPTFALGGASDSIFILSKFLVKKNFSVLVLSIGKNHYKGKFINLGCEVIEINSKRSLFSIFKYRKIIKNEIKKKYSQTILISNIHYANIISLIACYKIKGLKIILTERSSLSELSIFKSFITSTKNKLILLLAVYLYRFSDLIITNSIYEKNYIKENFKVKKIKCIHPPSIKNISRKYKKIYNLKKKKIIYVGRLSKEKGVDIIIDALSIVSKKYKFLFEIYGKGKDKKILQNLVKHHKMEKKVLFKGFLYNKNKIFKNADLFINASKFEGLPNALVQSLNYGIFPICTNSPGGNMEVIKFGKLGLSFKTDNIFDLKNKIEFFIEKKLRLNNKIRVQHLKKFTEEISNNKYLEILNRLK